MMDQNSIAKLKCSRCFFPAVEGSTVSINEAIKEYLKVHLPESEDSVTHLIPKKFEEEENQGKYAESITYNLFSNLKLPADNLGPFWLVCFHGTNFNKEPEPKTLDEELNKKWIIGENDFTVFCKYGGKFFTAIIEIKSFCDDENKEFKIRNETKKLFASRQAKISKGKVYALKQLEKVLTILKDQENISEDNINTFVFWPFLNKCKGAEAVPRWDGEKHPSHVFTDVLDSKQDIFDSWFHKDILGGKSIDEISFHNMLKMYIILNCGVFVKEVDDDSLAFLNQQQLQIMNMKPKKDGSPLYFDGNVGSGKTFLVLRKLVKLCEEELIDSVNKAVYICTYDLLRHDFRLSLKLNLQQLEKERGKNYNEYIDTLLHTEKLTKKYRHIFIDEHVHPRMTNDHKKLLKLLKHIRLVDDGNFNEKFKHRDGDFWCFAAGLFLQTWKYPIIQKIHNDLILKTNFRNTKTIHNIIVDCGVKKFGRQENTYKLGYDVIDPPPAFWLHSNKDKCGSVCKVILDLFSKGTNLSNVCVICVTTRITAKNLNDAISSKINHDYKPYAETDYNKVKYVSTEKPTKSSNNFLFVDNQSTTGLQFPIVIFCLAALRRYQRGAKANSEILKHFTKKTDMGFNDEEFAELFLNYDFYTNVSRCTSLLIVISNNKIRKRVINHKLFRKYDTQSNYLCRK